MNVARFYCPELCPGTVVLPDAEARHAQRVLRLAAGDTIELFDGHGRAARATLQDASATSRSAKHPPLVADVHEIRTDPPPAATLTLITAGCKGDRLDTLVEKCTELGVTRLLLTEFARSVVHVRRTDKLERTALEACKQCGRNRLPDITRAASLDDAAARVAEATLLIAHPSPEATPLAAWLHQHHAAWHHQRPSAPRVAAPAASPGAPTASARAIVIGPEGGLTDDEVATLVARGGTLVSLAPHILRVETAAIAAAATLAATQPGQ